MAAREIGDHLVLFYPRSKELVVAGRVLIFHKVGLVCLYRALVGVQMDLLELRGARGGSGALKSQVSATVNSNIGGNGGTGVVYIIEYF